jgi:hypothetical protein
MILMDYLVFLLRCAGCSKKPRTKSINAVNKAQPDVRRTAMDKQKLMEVFQERTQAQVRNNITHTKSIRAFKVHRRP